jgi:hypothetical protein
MNILQPTKVGTENGGFKAPHNSPHKLMGTKISLGTKDLGFGTWSVHKVRNVKICQETIGCAKT